MTPEPLTCVLCLRIDRDVAMALIRHTDPTGRRYYSTDPRCRDRVSCAEREAQALDDLDAMAPGNFA